MLLGAIAPDASRRSLRSCPVTGRTLRNSMRKSGLVKKDGCNVFLDIFFQIFLWSNIGHLEVHFRNLRLISILCWVGEIPTTHFVDGPWWGYLLWILFPRFFSGVSGLHGFSLRIEHTFVTDSPFRDIAHAIVNRQQKMDERFFNTVVEATSAENGIWSPWVFFEKRDGYPRNQIFVVNVSPMAFYVISYNLHISLLNLHEFTAFYSVKFQWVLGPPIQTQLIHVHVYSVLWYLTTFLPKTCPSHPHHRSVWSISMAMDPLITQRMISKSWPLSSTPLQGSWQESEPFALPVTWRPFGWRNSDSLRKP